MSIRLVALDEGSDIPVDREILVVGRHPQCDARIDSIRVSRRHCCMTQKNGEVTVRDLGSTNGIRINGQRVESGRLRPGDELSIAHIRYRLDTGPAQDKTLADSGASLIRGGLHREPPSPRDDQPAVVAAVAPVAARSAALAADDNKALAAALRDLLPGGVVPDRCRIQVIVQVPREEEEEDNGPESPLDPCPHDSSH
jgi:hypothetical protein